MARTDELDQLISDLIADRVVESGLSADEVARAALLRGLTSSPDERIQAADRVRAMTPRVLDDSTVMIRRMRDAR